MPSGVPEAQISAGQIDHHKMHQPFSGILHDIIGGQRRYQTKQEQQDEKELPEPFF